MSVNRCTRTRVNDIFVEYSLLLCCRPAAQCTSTDPLRYIIMCLLLAHAQMLMQADIYNFPITLRLSRANGIVPAQRCIQSISKWFYFIGAPEWARASTENERKIVKEQMKRRTFVIHTMTIWCVREMGSAHWEMQRKFNASRFRVCWVNGNQKFQKQNDRPWHRPPGIDIVIKYILHHPLFAGNFSYCWRNCLHWGAYKMIDDETCESRRVSAKLARRQTTSRRLNGC